MSANLTGVVTITPLQSGGAPAVAPLNIGTVVLTPPSTGVSGITPRFEGIITIIPEV